jgi:class 3 adenylate cyclase/tetratricopeptide (TPR) repeat protein
MSEKLDPEEVKEITGRIFGEVSKIVSKYDGFIEKYAGDAVMALFGATQSHEDDPVRAVKSAKEIHDLVKASSPQYEEKIGQPLSMHTGINTGLVVTGELNLEKGVHGVAGDTVNIASRLSSIAEPGDILIGPVTYSRAEGFFNFESLEPAEVKGKAKPIQIYKYLSSIEQPRKIHRLHGLRADLIGRKAEMAQLSEAIDNLANGQGSVFSIIGTSGTGKSRLIEEFKTTLNLEEVQWREGHAYPYSQNIPYFPLIDLINRTLQIEEGDSPEKIREKIESSIELLIGEKDDIAPYLGSLYSLNYPEIENVSPEYWKSKLQRGMLMLLSAIAKQGLTIICLEDLHWADPSSLDLVRFLLSEIREPLIFICAYRPIITLFSSHQISTLPHPHYEINLKDLSQTESQKMVQSLLKADMIPYDLQRFIQDKVEGNPFYLEEAINSLIESDSLVRDNGGWRITQQIGEANISSTIQGVISARIDRLAKDSKRILQEASVIGRSFYYEILKQITELKQSIDKSLSGLERLDLIKTKAIQPDLEYIFKHALTQEVVYNGLLKKERREIHEQIGLVMEQLFQERLPEFYETLAFHFKQGRSFHKAIDYLMKSGEKSIKRYAVEESNRYYEEAFELLTNKSNRSREEEELLIELFSKWALVIYYCGDFKQLTNLLMANEDLAAVLNNKAKAGMYYAWLGFALFFRGKLKDSYRYLCKALELGEEANKQRVVGYACTWLPFTCMALGKMEEAIAQGKRAQKISRMYPEDHYIYFKSLAALGLTYYFKGDKKKLNDTEITLLDYGRKHANVRCTVLGNWMKILGYHLDGNFQGAVEFYNKMGNVAMDPYYSQMETLYLGVSYFLNNQLQESKEPLDEFVTYSKQMGCEIFENMALVLLGVLKITKGYMRQGIELLKETQQILLSTDNLLFYAQSVYILGNVYLQIVVGARPKKLSTVTRNIGFIIKNAPLADRMAEAHFNNAIDIARKIGAKGILAQAYLDLGRLHIAKKRTDNARKCISEAITVFEKCEAKSFLKLAKEAMERLN